MFFFPKNERPLIRLKIPRLRPLVLLIRRRWMRSIDGMILRGKTEVPSEKPVPVSLYPPETSHRQVCDQNLGLRCERLRNKCLTHSSNLWRLMKIVKICLSQMFLDIRKKHCFLYFSVFFFLKSIEKIRHWPKYRKNNGYFTWRRFYIYDNTSLNYS